jgi:valyl-tRNA synthetase
VATQQISKSYDPEATEQRLYDWWEESGFFTADPESPRPPFCMVLPPPNVTGSLHMGHALNHTLQDILARWKRMQGYNVLWLPGTDHAGIATQNVVERNLAADGKKRTDFSREEFERIVWDWKETSEDRILRQVRRLGCSCDWTRNRFTLDEGLSRAVREVFVRLYDDGLIYRGEYMVNWCPRCGTAISDLEVEYEAVEGHLWHLRYPVKGTDRYVVVATTRPETMLGDTAVAVHPADERYRWLHGKTVLLPLMDREIPVITDTFVEREFGTGVVKVTPGHDPNDYEAGRRHDLPIIRVIDDDATMTDQAGRFASLDRYEARKQVVEALEGLGLLEKTERYSHNVGQCQRCQTVVEPLVSTQWFVRVKPLAEEAIRAVERGDTRFVPENFARIYFEWMRNIHDWCISRQLWWGHRIPAWYCEDCGEMLVTRVAPSRCNSCQSDRLKQESDVLDTWFSSGLWPFSTLGWPDETREQDVFYPTSVLVTAFDIIFFWVARMIMMGLRFKGEVPFRLVYINGLVRDENRRKMSKSRGNVIDPLDLVNEYGTDAVRFTLAVMAVPGADIPFSISRMAGYRAFCNKIWNAARFLQLNLEPGAQPVDEEDVEELLACEELELEHRWIVSRLHNMIQRTGEDLEKLLIHEASNSLYHFFWGEFCDWYIELAKSGLTSDDPARRKRAQKVAAYVLETSLRLLHPLIPFITEDLWQRVPHRGETIMLAPYPQARTDWQSGEVTESMGRLQELITAMRTAKAENRVELRKRVKSVLSCRPEDRKFLQSQVEHLQRLVFLEEVTFAGALPAQGLQIQGVSRLAEFAMLLDDVDVDLEIQRLQKERERLRDELAGLERKLANSNFIEKAPEEVVGGARQRRDEVAEKLGRVDDQLRSLGAA